LKYALLGRRSVALKIGIPKIRLTRKVIIISLGMLVLLGGSGAAALYVGGDKLLGGQPEAESAAGKECTTFQTMVLKTPARRLWMRKYIRIENADGPTRIRTALRVAGLLAKSNAVDLIQINVLDSHGTEKRADMRGRAIGAEVIFALQPDHLPEMKEPFVARYYDGLANSEGRFYGRKVTLKLDDIKTLMTAMKSTPDLADCAEVERAEDPAAAKDGKKANEHGKPAGTVTAGEHGKPAAEGEHEKPAAEGEHAAPGEEAKAGEHEAAPVKEQSFMDSMLGMVGLGGAEEKPAEAHEAKADDSTHGKADEAGDAKPAEDHAAQPESHEDRAAPADSLDATTEHAPTKAEEHGEAPAEEPAADHAAVSAEHEAAPAEEEATPSEKTAH
jgi:hypothetical protein